ncbi:hypothetical protein SK128_027149 [Halocaridina rubra]|uniref:MADF domain-containing protein n=1 Tax=Halocaridina rubra TaxID=373956 RepID=A0AAN8X2T0_HALRR
MDVVMLRASPLSDAQLLRPTFEWTRNMTLRLIELYRDRPCLWQHKSDAYRNKAQKRKAYRDLYAYVKSVNPKCTLDIVKNKLHSIRGQYKRELKLIAASKKAGASAEEVYVPRLWCFNHLEFLDEEDKQSEATSSTNPVETSMLNESAFEWTRSLTEKLIELYRRIPCLWNRSSEQYKDQEARVRGYLQLTDSLKVYHPGCTVYQVKKKLNTLRSQYRREIRECNSLRSKRSKFGDTFETKLWCFKDLAFIDDISQGDIQNNTSSALEDPINTYIEKADEVFIDEKQPSFSSPITQATLIDPLHPAAVTNEHAPLGRKFWKKKRKSNLLSNSCSYPEKELKRRKVVPENEDDSSCMGEVVTVELRQMTPQQRAIAKKLIYDVMYNANLGRLSTLSKVVCEELVDPLAM